MDETTNSLLERCASGDQEAWHRLVERFAGLVYAVARRQGLTEDQCDDCAQTVYSILMRRIVCIDRGGSFAAWLTTTTKREAWRILRERMIRVAVAHEPSDGSAEPDESLAQLERRHRLQEGLSRLGAKCRALIEELFMTAGEPDYQSIASRLSIPIGSIGPTRKRCLAQLAALIGTDSVG